MSISKRGDEKGRPFKSMGQHDEFLTRITKTLYYTKLPKTERLSLPVSELASDLFSEIKQGHSLNLLYCEDVATISRNACVSPCSLVLALLYLERLKKCNIDYLRCVDPSKLFLISLMISSKYLHDDGEEDEVFTDEWARSGDITVPELCQLEKEFLNAIDWNVFVYESSFWDRLKKLEQEIALREGLKRGWFTYTELNSLIEKQDIASVVNNIVTFSAVLAATYAAGILTLVGSVFLTSRVPGTSLYYSQQMEQSPLPLEPLGTNLPQDISIPQVLTDEALNDTKYLPKISTSTVTVINTSILLVSLFSCNENLGCEETARAENVGWDWWNNSLMNWLTEISEVEEYEPFTLPDNYFKNFASDKLLDMSIANKKKLELEDKIHKATKVRLQEQIERSWHEEWTDSFYTTISLFYPISFY